MTEYEEKALTTLKGIHDELVSARKEREAIRQEEREQHELFCAKLAAEKEARRKEHEAYLATVQSAPCEGSSLSKHLRPR